MPGERRPITATSRRPEDRSRRDRVRAVAGDSPRNRPAATRPIRPTRCAPDTTRSRPAATGTRPAGRRVRDPAAPVAPKRRKRGKRRWGRGARADAADRLAARRRRHPRRRRLAGHHTAPRAGADRLPRSARRPAAAPTGCSSARTAARASPPSSSKTWPPAATSATAAPTPSCWSTCRGSGPSTPPTMVSIPRDSYVPIPGHGKDKINAAFAMGGAPLLTQTVEQATGLRLDHYAEIGFGGFAALVDALGGVTVCPTDADQRSVGRHRPAGRLPAAGRSQRARVTSGPGTHRGRIWTGWSTSGSSSRRCCTAPPARRCGSIRGAGTRCRVRPPTR